MPSLPRVNIKVRKGNEYLLTLTVKDSAGAVVSLVGVTSLSWKVTTGQDDTVALFTAKTISAGITVIDDAGGIITIAIDETDLVMSAGYYYHELQMVDTASVTQTSLRGTFHVEGVSH